MSPRRRSSKRRDFPANLYERDGYYSWRDPRTREEQPLGRISKPDAFAQALEANMLLARMLNKPRLIDRLTGNADRSLGKWIAKYEGLLAARNLAPNTQRSNKSYGKRTVEAFKADTPLRNITALMVSDALAALGPTRTAQAWRAYLKDSFREAEVAGWVDANPVRETRTAPVKVRRARLELPVLLRVYQATDLPWLKNAIALALVSAQRREDISQAQRKDFKEGAWWVEQGKTGSRITLPLELRLEAFGMSLDDVYKQCKATGVLSPYLIHQTVERGNSTVGQQIWIDTISRRFSEVLAALGLDWGDKTPPTFHEIRSLSERLYRAQGNVNTQELLGHRDPRMTQVYHDARGAWVKLAVGKISNG